MRGAGARSRLQGKAKPAVGRTPPVSRKRKPAAPAPLFFGAGGAGLSSRNVAWNTPKAVVDAILRALKRRRFDLDPCAPADSGGHVPAALAYTEEQDGLSLPWSGTAYVNPPYARYVTARWVERCRLAVAEGECRLVVALLPARTGSGWWFDNVFRAGGGRHFPARTPAIRRRQRGRAVRQRARLVGGDGPPGARPRGGLPVRPPGPGRRAVSQGERTFLELFCGIGAVAEALGGSFAPALANDVCEWKAALYRANHPGSPLTVGDVKRLHRADVPQTSLLWASSPCQDVSSAGRRSGLYARRSGLAFTVIKLVRALANHRRAPRVVVFENVPGLVSTEGGAPF